MIHALRLHFAKRRLAYLEQRHADAQAAYLDAKRRQDTRTQHARWKDYAAATEDALALEARIGLGVPGQRSARA